MISVVVPMLNEAENVASLVNEILSAAQHAPIAEIVLVDDGSDDGTGDKIRELKKIHNNITLVSHAQRSGQSAATRTGVRVAKGPLIITMDGDGQNNPVDIQKLYAAWQAQSPQPQMLLVAGQREKRADNIIKKFTSRSGNAIRSFVLNDSVRDTGCSLKLFRRDDYLALPFFNHMHRFLAALFLREHGKIILVDVGHRPRNAGISKYGFWDRLAASIFDLIGVVWLQRRGPTLTRIDIE
jgi:dolichol-phosphate mannosyltransferase